MHKSFNKESITVIITCLLIVHGDAIHLFVIRFSQMYILVYICDKIDIGDIMKLGFSSNAFKAYSLETCIREMRAIGYEG